MNTHNIELPALAGFAAGNANWTIPQLIHEYARAAIAPYAQRIRELESQLEAIGAGGVSSQRVTSQRGGEPVGAPSDSDRPNTLEMCLNPRPVSGGNPVYLYRRRGMGMTYFSSTTKEQYDAYLERPDLVETITLYTAPQPTDPVISDRQILLKLMEAFDTETWQCPICGHAEDTATMDSADMLRDYLKGMTAAGPAKAPSDESIIEFLGSVEAKAADVYIKGEWAYLDKLKFARALLARYGHPVEPEGWQLVPKEPTIDMMFMGVSEWSVHDDPEEYVHGVWEAMLEAAPEPPCET